VKVHWTIPVLLPRVSFWCVVVFPIAYSVCYNREHGHYCCLNPSRLILYVVGNNYLVKSTIFWDITPYSPLKLNWRFGGTYYLHLQGRRISRARNKRESRWQAEPLAVNGLHSIISQKMELFITTAVRTSDPTWWCSYRKPEPCDKHMLSHALNLTEDYHNLFITSIFLLRWSFNVVVTESGMSRYSREPTGQCDGFLYRFTAFIIFYSTFLRFYYKGSLSSAVNSGCCRIWVLSAAVIKSSVFRVITLCRPLKALLATRFMLASCLAYSATLKLEATCSSETSVTFNGVHGVISHFSLLDISFYFCSL
jgi:hypothetical protein